jgi:tetratricopeptide (TPR) repeat protein
VNDFQNGNRLFAQHRYQEALDAYLEHARACPEDAANAYAYAARCCPHINVLPESKPVAPGATLIHQGNMKGTEEYCRAALAIDPNHFLALKQLATVLPKKSAERLEILERATALRPDPVLLADLGDYYRNGARDFERAYWTYLRAQEAHPEDETAYRRLNDVCRRMGRADEAKAWSARWKEVNRKRFVHRS